MVEGGREYIVAPMTLINPGVLPGSKGPLLYPPEECARNAADWNGTPLVVYHPQHPLTGEHLSAQAPGVLERSGVGEVRGSRFNGKLRAEGWFDVEKTRRVDPRVLKALTNGKPLELSTGLFTDNEPAPQGATHDGRPYSHIARGYRPDHLAILPDQTGACSIRDGCGVLVNAKDALGHGSWKRGEVPEASEKALAASKHAYEVGADLGGPAGALTEMAHAEAREASGHVKSKTSLPQAAIAHHEQAAEHHHEAVQNLEPGPEMLAHQEAEHAHRQAMDKVLKKVPAKDLAFWATGKAQEAANETGRGGAGRAIKRISQGKHLDMAAQHDRQEVVHAELADRADEREDAENYNKHDKAAFWHRTAAALHRRAEAEKPAEPTGNQDMTDKQKSLIWQKLGDVLGVTNQSQPRHQETGQYLNKNGKAGVKQTHAAAAKGAGSVAWDKARGHDAPQTAEQDDFEPAEEEMDEDDAPAQLVGKHNAPDDDGRDIATVGRRGSVEPLPEDDHISNKHKVPTPPYRCTECGAEHGLDVLGGDGTCPECGGRLTLNKKKSGTLECSKCGEEYPEGENGLEAGDECPDCDGKLFRPAGTLAKNSNPQGCNQHKHCNGGGDEGGVSESARQATLKARIASEATSTSSGKKPDFDAKPGQSHGPMHPAADAHAAVLAATKAVKSPARAKDMHTQAIGHHRTAIAKHEKRISIQDGEAAAAHREALQAHKDALTKLGGKGIYVNKAHKNRRGTRAGSQTTNGFQGYQPQQALQASRQAATASLHSDHDGAFGHAKSALGAAKDGDSASAFPFHKKAATMHEAAATDARVDGDQDGADQHDQAAALHRKAASLHKAGVLDKQDQPAGQTPPPVETPSNAPQPPTGNASGDDEDQDEDDNDRDQDGDGDEDEDDQDDDEDSEDGDDQDQDQEATMNRKKAIKHLVANCKCQEAALNALDDKTLVNLANNSLVANAASQGFIADDGWIYRINPVTAKPERRQPTANEKAQGSNADVIGDEDSIQAGGEEDSDDHDYESDDDGMVDKAKKGTKAKADDNGIGTMNARQWMASAPQDLREVLSEGLQHRKNIRASYLNKLTANVRDDRQRARLRAAYAKHTTEELRDMAANMAPVVTSNGVVTGWGDEPALNFLGAAAADGVANSYEDSGEADLLALPTLNFDQDRLKRSTDASRVARAE